MLRQISAIVASKRFPFRTDGDVYRWAVWVGIQLLDHLEPTPNTFICRIDAANAIIREQVYLQEYAATLNELDRAVQSYMAMNARGQAVKMIAQVQHQYSKIEEDYWRERLLREVKERFGHLMAGRQAEAKMSEGGSDDDERQ